MASTPTLNETVKELESDGWFVPGVLGKQYIMTVMDRTIGEMESNETRTIELRSPYGDTKKLTLSYADTQQLHWSVK